MRSLLAVAFVALLVAAPASAHDTWLLSRSASARPGATLELSLTSGMGFPENDAAVAADRLVATGLRLAGRTTPLAVAGPERGGLRLTATPSAAGVAVAWAETKPRTLTIEPQELHHYLEEIGALETVGREWEARGRPEWRESYVKIAKAILRVGGGEDASWGEPLGLALELVPEADPTRLRPGETLPVRLLLAGHPVADLAIGALGAGARATLTRTDAEGRARVIIDRSGPWLLRATLIRPPATAEAPWQSHFTTLTLHVGAPD